MSMTIRQKWVFAALWLAMLAAIALQCAVPLAYLPYHVSWNNNEGWNAYWAARALAGAPLYTDAASPLANNYPPLSFYIVGLSGRLIGDPVIAGRIICLAGLIVSTALVERIIARFGGARIWGVAAAAVLLLDIASIAQRYVAANDPQWLAQATMLGGLLLVVARTPVVPPRPRIIGACLLMLVSGLIKHNQIALPIAATIWLALYDRRALAAWLATAAVAGGAALGVLALVFGHPFFDQVLHHQRVIDHRLIVGAIHSLSYVLPEFVLTLILLFTRPRDPRLALLLLFAMLAIPIGIGERLGIGVSQNAHFDSEIALLILAGVILSQGMIGLHSAWARLAVLAVMIAPLAHKDFRFAATSIRTAMAARQTDAQWRTAIAFLASRDGPVACERSALCYWSGKPYALDFSNYGQKLRKGHDPIDLRDKIAHRSFAALLELRDDRYMAGRGRLPDEYYRLIEANYRVVQVLPDDLYVLAPIG